MTVAVDEGAAEKEHDFAPVALFGLWFLAFMLLESFVNVRAAELLGAEAVNAVYSAGICCSATGMLAFGISQGIKDGRRSVSALASVVVVAVMAIVVAFAQSAALLLAASFVALLSCGFMGGAAHEGFSREYGESPAVGRVLGMTAGAVICVQFVMQNLTHGALPTLAFILATAIAYAFVCLRGAIPVQMRLLLGSRDVPPRLWPEDAMDRRRHGALIVMAAAILTVIFTLNDSIVVALDASGTLQLFDGIRLFYALGLVVAGILYDVGPRFLFVFATVAVQIMAVLVPYFLWTPQWYNLNVGIFYFYGGFYVMFITAEFVTFAIHMPNLALWAGLGRTVRGYAAGLSVIPVALLYAAFGVVSLVGVGVVLNMGLLAVCVADLALVDRVRTRELQTAMPSASSTTAAIEFDVRDIERYAEDICLTDREREVLVLMVTTEDENQKMANDLGISRRTLQRHIAQVYDKAGVQSRIGLYKSLVAYAAAHKE